MMEPLVLFMSFIDNSRKRVFNETRFGDSISEVFDCWTFKYNRFLLSLRGTPFYWSELYCRQYSFIFCWCHQFILLEQIKYVFDNERSDLSSLISSFSKLLASSAFTGLIINNILLYFWVSVLGISSILGPLLNLFVTYPLNYILSKYWAFK